MKKYMALILLAQLFLVGCATYKLPLYNGPVQTGQIFNKSYDEVYDGVTKTAFGMNLNTVVLDKPSGLQRFESAGINGVEIQRYTNARNRFGRELSFQGSKADINILVSKQDAGTNVAIRCNFDVAYSAFTGNQFQPIQTVYEPSPTTGLLETEIFLNIAKLLGDSKAIKELSSRMNYYR